MHVAAYGCPDIVYGDRAGAVSAARIIGLTSDFAAKRAHRARASYASHRERFQAGLALHRR